MGRNRNEKETENHDEKHALPPLSGDKTDTDITEKPEKIKPKKEKNTTIIITNENKIEQNIVQSESTTKETNEKITTSPVQTGDNSNIILYIVLGILSFGIIICLIIWRKFYGN